MTTESLTVYPVILRRFGKINNPTMTSETRTSGQTAAHRQNDLLNHISTSAASMSRAPQPLSERDKEELGDFRSALNGMLQDPCDEVVHQYAGVALELVERLLR